MDNQILPLNKLMLAGVGFAFKNGIMWISGPFVMRRHKVRGFVGPFDSPCSPIPTPVLLERVHDDKRSISAHGGDCRRVKYRGVYPLYA
jgi:hypothetical protein